MYVCVFSYKVLCPSFPISTPKVSSLMKCDFARRKHGFIIPFICSILDICSKSDGLWECRAHGFYKVILIVDERVNPITKTWLSMWGGRGDACKTVFMFPVEYPGLKVTRR